MHNNTTALGNNRHKLRDVYEALLEALELDHTFGRDGPSILVERKELQLLYTKYRRSLDNHVKWTAEIARIVLQFDDFLSMLFILHGQESRVVSIIVH